MSDHNNEIIVAAGWNASDPFLAISKLADKNLAPTCKKINKPTKRESLRIPILASSLNITGLLIISLLSFRINLRIKK